MCCYGWEKLISKEIIIIKKGKFYKDITGDKTIDYERKVPEWIKRMSKDARVAGKIFFNY